ncbi:hypothetical protein [Microbacterium sp. No. 7]|uniref:hypothetical protein n=1 Tax=Microbacterium sp. No. 7 TaxID=1714373 RepID=UPI0006CF77A4|nr:hypothetical protein [Microbacterium sp. No. 7]ALJ21260.1 hypothetical protein AOA12_15670 [Microbacterium sp. No. 7]
MTIDENTPLVPQASADGAGVSRRRVVKAAAWSAPVVAVVVAAPYAAATTTITGIALAPGSCALVAPGATIPAIGMNVTPAAAAAVTLTLTGGYTFASTGTAVATVTTDASGHYDIDDVVAPSGVGAAGTITATAVADSSVTTTATLPAVGAPTYGWGYGAQGQIGNGTTGETYSTAVAWQLPAETVAVGSTYSGLAAVTADGLLYTVGYNGYGDLANGSTSDNNTPAAALLHGTSTPIDNVVHVSNTSNDEAIVYVRRGDGTWWGAGENNSNSMARIGQPYSGEPTFTGFVQMGLDVLAQPGNAGASISWVDISACTGRASTTMAIYTLSDGTVWTAGEGWSRGGSGVGIGNGVTGIVSGVFQLQTAAGAPVTGMVKAEGVYQSSIMLLDAAGNLWYAGYDGFTAAAGYSNNGYVQSYPKPEGKTVTDIIAAGQFSYYAITSDGSAYAVGDNMGGKFGVGAAGNSNAWRKVLLDDVVEIASGGDGTLFRTGSGEVFFAGVSDRGQSGNGVNGQQYLTPTKATSLPGPAISIASSWWDSHAAVVSLC